MLLRIALFLVVACLALLVVGAEDYYKVCVTYFARPALHTPQRILYSTIVDLRFCVAAGSQEKRFRTRNQESVPESKQEIPPRQESVC